MKKVAEQTTSSLRYLRGFAMLEILITISVLSFGLMGLAGLQLMGMKYNYSAYQRSQITILTADIVDRMRANRNVALTGSYDIAVGLQPGKSSCNGVGANCTVNAMAAADLYDWKQAMSTILPSGDGSIVRNGTNFTITVQWDDTRGEGALKSLAMETIL